MWSSDDNAVKPMELIRNLKNHAPQFTQGSQEDCQEFLIFLLDIIHEVKFKKIFNNFFLKDLNRVRPGKIDYRDNRPLKVSGSSALEIEAAKEWRKYLEKNRSIIVDLFQV